MQLDKTLIAGLTLALAAGSALADKPRRDAPPPQPTTPTASRQNEPLLKATFSTTEIQTLRTYYQQEQPAKHGKSLPPGLQKKLARGGQLPPGWQKKVARGEVMPQDVYAAAKPVPVTVIHQLPPQPPGTVIVQLEGKLVRLAQATMEIIDILDL